MHKPPPARLKTFDYRGFHRYFLTFCVENRRTAFGDARAVDLVLSQILRAAAREGFAVLAYCFMPDHLHLLVEAESPDADCRRFIVLAKQLSAFHYRKSFGMPLWQRYGYERVLRSDEAALGVARYILENPMRAKLTERIDGYPYSGSTVFTIEQIVEAVHWSPRRSSG